MDTHGNGHAGGSINKEINGAISQVGDGDHVGGPVVSSDASVSVARNGLKECLEAEEHPPKEEGGEGKEQEAAPDGGYGWVIVFSCFLSHVLLGGLGRNDGIFFLQFRDRYGKSAQLTAWVLALVTSIRLLFGPVASTLCGRFSARATVMVGGIQITLACLLTAYAPDFWFLFFSHTALQGFGRGFMYAPPLIMIGQYFDKRRGLSTGVGTSGVGVGTFFLVPLTQLLFDFYGFQGAFLILTAIVTNSFVVAMLLRPLSLHRKFARAFARSDYVGPWQLL
ncbi:monocarboxylate transporter 12-like [Aplysia californica]|uniref:Monocarboxylate transporter 12-like n=1 Tax=Aplysia californica TaxID=6500 RepID=A0ABM0JR28_APLCA|nr:monocarboxylate transporter 12-like [Aplysia californica]